MYEEKDEAVKNLNSRLLDLGLDKESCLGNLTVDININLREEFLS